MWAFPVKRLTIPLNPSPAPIGISTGIAPAASISLTSARTSAKLACTLSIIDTNTMRGRPRSSHNCHTISVPTSTPDVALTVTSAASATASTIL